jgi:hypothetical protein
VARFLILKYDVSIIISGTRPNTNVKTISGNSKKYSLLVISCCLPIKIILGLPNISLLNNQIEYIELNNIPKEARTMIDIFFSLIPIRTNSSLIKLEVPGKAMLAIVKKKNTVEKIGILITNPP